MNNTKKLLLRSKQAVKILAIQEDENNSSLFFYRDLLREIEEELVIHESKDEYGKVQIIAHRTP